MNKMWIKYQLLFIIVLVFASCAQINPLEGGEKDVFAPQIDSTGTSPFSGQTNFNGNEIIIKFKEYIVLNKPNDNIIITPQLGDKPTISAKNKKLSIRFNESLQDNTTYTITFNHAIADLTEKNDSVFQFVFSTGDYIDSLEVKGKITNGFTNKPSEGYLVGLYNANTDLQFDSIPYKEQPIYITQSNRSGNFTMSYLKKGEYYIFAFDDKNRNLRLDPSENRAFILNEKIKIDTINPFVKMLSYKPATGGVKLTATKFDFPGRIEFVFNNEPETFTVNSTIELLQEQTGEKDSLVFWLSKNPTAKMKFILNLNNEIDTIKPLYKDAKKASKNISLTITNNLIGGKLLPNKNFELLISEAIDIIQPNGLHFMTKDSVELAPVNATIKNIRSVLFDTLNKNTAFLKIDSAAINSKYNHSNTSEQWIAISILEQDYFGSLILNIDTIFNSSVFVELLNDKKEVVKTMPFNQKLEFLELIPGKYQVRLIFDANKDGKWTTGSLIEKRLPENIIYNKELIAIKSRWEKEVDWIIEN